MIKFKIVFGSALMLLSTVVTGQNYSSTASDITKTTKKVSEIKNKDGVMVKYRMKIIERKVYPIAFDEEDNSKANQNRVIVPAEVTKIIYLDNDYDKYYDKYIVVRHYESYGDKIEFVPTENGLGIKVDNKNIADVNRAGYYLTDADDNDFFIVEEFRTM